MLMRLYDICYVMHDSMLSSKSNCVNCFCCVDNWSESVCYNLCKNSCDSYFIVLYLWFIVIINDIKNMDVKGPIDLGSVICDLIFVKSNAALPDLPALSQGAEIWFQHLPILLRVRLWPAQAGHCRKGQYYRGLLANLKSKPGSRPLKPTNGSISGTGSILREIG